MRLTCANGDPLWLGYGMNVHAGGAPETLERAIETTVVPLRRRLGAAGPFGVALRLDAEGVRALEADGGRLRALRQLLATHDLVPFTVNGFVHGRFHGAGVKDQVYRPSWREAAREDYTVGLAGVMAALRGPGHVVSLSTAPGSWRGWGEEPAQVARDVAERLVRTAQRLRDLEHRTGVRVVLGLEPEPGCTLERVDETVRFFHGPLARAFGRELGARLHVGVCLDVCHQAVMFEDVRHGLDRLKAAGIPVAKVQASAALELPDPTDAAGRAALAGFVEPTWLHQTTTHDAQGHVHLAPDLPAALAAEGEPWRTRRPWRTHFHVPVFRAEAVAPLKTTQPELERVLGRVAQGGATRHLEVETYTWDALPEHERRAGSGFDLVEALARELGWVRAALERAGARAEGPVRPRTPAPPAQPTSPATEL
jgi:sugar phosphate isomerase/epimerase